MSSEFFYVEYFCLVTFIFCLIEITFLLNFKNFGNILYVLCVLSFSDIYLHNE